MLSPTLSKGDRSNRDPPLRPESQFNRNPYPPSDLFQPCKVACSHVAFASGHSSSSYPEGLSFLLPFTYTSSSWRRWQIHHRPVFVVPLSKREHIAPLRKSLLCKWGRLDIQCGVGLALLCIQMLNTGPQDLVAPQWVDPSVHQVMLVNFVHKLIG